MQSEIKNYGTNCNDKLLKEIILNIFTGMEDSSIIKKRSFQKEVSYLTDEMILRTSLWYYKPQELRKVQEVHSALYASCHYTRMSK